MGATEVQKKQVEVSNLDTDGHGEALRALFLHKVMYICFPDTLTQSSTKWQKLSNHFLPMQKSI